MSHSRPDEQKHVVLLRELAEVAEAAEKRLLETPYHQLGPASRILVDSYQPSAPEKNAMPQVRISDEEHAESRKAIDGDSLSPAWPCGPNSR